MRKLIKNILLKFRFFISIIDKDHYNKLNFFLLKIRPLETNHRLIRVGSDYDGGYLLPDDLDEVKYCFSPGVSDNISFETQLTKDYKINCFLCDYSVLAPPHDVEGHTFIKKFLGIKMDSQNVTLLNWINTYAPKEKNMILQMDIEGSEYDVLLDVQNNVLDKFRIIIIEFHHFSQILTPLGFKMLNLEFDKLLKSHSIVHIHPNNVGNYTKFKDLEIPEILEFTFLNNDRINESRFNYNFPHDLDMDNDIRYKSKPLPKCFYENS